MSKAPLTVKANDHTVVYGDAPTNGGVSYSGFIGTDTYLVLGGALEIANTYAAYSPVGTYVLTPSGYTSNNYEITYETGTLNVTKRAVSFTTLDQSITVGQSIDNTKYTATELVDGHTVTLTANGGEIVLDKILDTSGNDVTANYAVAYTSNGVYHCFDESTYVSDGTEHWHSCVIDGCIEKHNIGACHGGTATCTAKAICEVCKNEHGDLDETNHSFTTYVSDKNATAEADGTKTAKCDRGCGKTDSVIDLGSRLVTDVESPDANEAEPEEKEATTEDSKNFGGIAIAAVAVIGGITAACIVIIRKKGLGKKAR